MAKKENKIKAFIKELFKQMTYKNGKVYPPYIYIWGLLLFVILVQVLKIFVFPERISDAYALGMCGFVGAWMGIFTIKEVIK